MARIQKLGISEAATAALAEQVRIESARRDFASRLSLMKHEAGQLGLYATMHRLDVPLRMVGFEIAGDIAQCEKYEEKLP